MIRVTTVLAVLALLLSPVVVAAALGSVAWEDTTWLYLGLVALLALCEGDARALRTRIEGAAVGLPGPEAWGAAVACWIALLQHLVAAAPAHPQRTVGGAAVLAAGILLRWVAVRTLGRWFAGGPGVHPDQPLVTGGIYGQMRHPATTATVLIAAGAALLLDSPLALIAAMLVQVPLALWVARREDRRLREHFDQEFPAYREAVPALVPRPRGL